MWFICLWNQTEAYCVQCCDPRFCFLSKKYIRSSFYKVILKFENILNLENILQILGCKNIKVFIVISFIHKKQLVSSIFEIILKFGRTLKVQTLT